ncbi:MAG: glycosyltransferase [Nitrospirae bacterium]|nr:glycosyltransferase [Nitrospirota bacterium]MBF0593019.1 glycosyltransferase [Nitrospirota bacterium]
MSSVSVIIPTLNASRLIHPLVERLRTQKTGIGADVIEVIVIDSSSADSTVATANSLGCETIVIPAQEFNHGLTRNLAAGVARGDVLVFMTQDAMPSDDMVIAHLLAPLQDSAVAASYARQVCSKEASPLERFCRQFNYPGGAQLKDYEALAYMGIKTFFFSNVCSAIKRDVFLEMGGFVKTLMNEDMVFASGLIRSGYKVAYQPQAVVIHCHNYSVIEQLRRHFDIGVSLRDNTLLSYASPHGEGKRFLTTGVQHLLKEEGVYYVGYFFIDALFRYTGYSLGTRYTLLPGRLKRWLSNNPSYFKKKGGGAS